ncbi:MAG: glucose-6-phosphate isomerase [Bacteroidales bacterium]|nr:glucose-6-phosphate isomerase [Bacteroidales bacterium]
MIKVDFDFAGVCLNQDLQTCEKEMLLAHELIMNANGEGNDFLGWRDLPLQIENLLEIKNVAKKIREDNEILVVIGIGGSYLGARAVIEALSGAFESLKPKKESPLVLYAGENLSEDYMADLLGILQTRDFSLCVISKSGTTTEPAIAFRILKKALEEKYGKDKAKNRIVAITDKSKGVLRGLANENGYKTFDIKDDIGGRFSVLTPVGLLPVAVAGYDIEALMQGAREMREVLINDKSMSNPAWQYAAFRNILYNKGKKIEVFLTYLPALQYLSRWWQQLFGESEGKNGKGLFPVCLLNTTDLHSMGQYIQEGERIMFETVLQVKNNNKKVDIPYDQENKDGLNYLLSHSLNQINKIALKATQQAHIEGGVPQMRIEVEKIEEKTLGAVLYFFEFACALSAYALKVNPFNQPGVEAYKNNMFKLLGKI